MFLCLHSYLFTNSTNKSHFNNQHTQRIRKLQNSSLTFARSSFTLWERIPGAALTAKTTNKTKILQWGSRKDRRQVTEYEPGIIPLLTRSFLGPLCKSFRSKAATRNWQTQHS